MRGKKRGGASWGFRLTYGPKVVVKLEIKSRMRCIGGDVVRV